MLKLTNDEFINKANLIHNFKYNYDKLIYLKSSCKITITCENHGDFEQLANSHLNGRGCPICNTRKKKTTEYFIEESNKIHNNLYVYSKTIYKNNNTKVIITCKKHGDFEITPKKHIIGQGCVICSNTKRKTSDEFIKIAKEIHNDKYSYEKVSYINNKTCIIITCKEHGDFKQKPNSHLTGYGCSKCVKKYNYSQKEYIEEAIKIHKNKYNYSLTKYKNSSEKIIIICNKHGEFMQLPSAHLYSNGCPNCSESKGENKISSYLNDLGISYKRQQKFKDCVNIRCLPFDFYIPEYNMCIEFDGKQHFLPVDKFGGMESLEKTKINDDIKNKYCKNNNIKLHRIKYTDNVEEKLFEIINNKLW